jgi:hypothetical protein
MSRYSTRVAIWAIIFSPLAASKAAPALKAASHVFLIPGMPAIPPFEI